MAEEVLTFDLESGGSIPFYSHGQFEEMIKVIACRLWPGQNNQIISAVKERGEMEEK